MGFLQQTDLGKIKIFSDTCLFYYIDINVNALQALTSISTSSQCQLACQMEKQCLFFTFNVVTNVCYLKPGFGTSVGSLQPYFTSGPKYCGFSAGYYVKQFSFSYAATQGANDIRAI